MKLQLHWQILAAILLAILVGWLITPDTDLLGLNLYALFDFLGTLFLNGLKMIVVPLVVSSIIVGVANLGRDANLGRLGGKTIAFYALTTLLAILMALLLINVTSPGTIDGAPAGDRLNLSAPEEVEGQLNRVQGRGTGDIAAVFLRMVPSNLVEAAAADQLLGLIFFAILFGFFVTRVPEAPRQTVMRFWDGVFQTMMLITMFIMRFAPIGVFGLIAMTVAATGFAAFEPLLWFFGTVVLALLLHMFLTMALLLKFVAGVNPLLHYKAMGSALLTAFSTASSSATLPLTMRCLEQNAGVSNRTSAFVLPLGATINMDGTALYECAAAIFIAQAYGLDLTLATQFTVVLIALLTSIGVAGIPAASLVAITVILGAIGLPLEGIGMLLVTDRILDMMRTAVNVFGDSVCAVVIARSEGEQTLLLPTAGLATE